MLEIISYILGSALLFIVCANAWIWYARGKQIKSVQESKEALYKSPTVTTTYSHMNGKPLYVNAGDNPGATIPIERKNLLDPNWVTVGGGGTTQTTSYYVPTPLPKHITDNYYQDVNGYWYSKRYNIMVNSDKIGFSTPQDQLSYILSIPVSSPLDGDYTYGSGSDPLMKGAIITPAPEEPEKPEKPIKLTLRSNTLSYIAEILQSTPMSLDDILESVSMAHGEVKKNTL